MVEKVNFADIVIVGAGHGGAQAALMLRQHGFEGSILIVGREPDLPYDRPPLSKEYLSREKPFERLLLRPEQVWNEKQIVFLLGRSVIAVNPEARTVMLDDNASLGYGSLIWAGGGEPRKLACRGSNLRGVHAIRTRADVDRLMSEIDEAANGAVVIGGGYIGLEAAAVLRKLGLSVTLLEAQPRVLARVAGEQISAFYEAEHRAHGVDLRTGVSVECVEGVDRANGVRLTSGEIIPAGIVIVGIGIVPSVEPLIAAGAIGKNGVTVDELCRTSLGDVYAIGDCAAHASGFAEGALIRVESVQNANDMATTVARAICGEPQAYAATPWFWSNQYDLRLQTIGLSAGYDATVLRGNPASRSFSVIYLKASTVIALDCVNSVKDYVQGRKLVEGRMVIEPAKLADTAVALKDFAVSLPSVVGSLGQ